MLASMRTLHPYTGFTIVKPFHGPMRGCLCVPSLTVIQPLQTHWMASPDPLCAIVPIQRCPVPAQVGMLCVSLTLQYQGTAHRAQQHHSHSSGHAVSGDDIARMSLSAEPGPGQCMTSCDCRFVPGAHGECCRFESGKGCIPQFSHEQRGRIW